MIYYCYNVDELRRRGNTKKLIVKHIEIAVIGLERV